MKGYPLTAVSAVVLTAAVIELAMITWFWFLSLVRKEQVDFERNRADELLAVARTKDEIIRNSASNDQLVQDLYAHAEDILTRGRHYGVVWVDQHKLANLLGQAAQRIDAYHKSGVKLSPATERALRLAQPDSIHGAL